jgi:hypothetical protein
MREDSILFWLDAFTVLVVATAGLVVMVSVARWVWELSPLARAPLETLGLAVPIAAVDQLLNLSGLASHLLIGASGAIGGTLIAIHYYGPYHGEEKQARVQAVERAAGLGLGEAHGTSREAD